MISKTHTKYIQSLQHKKFRDEYGEFIAEGPKVVTELLACGKFNCRELYAVNTWLDAHAALPKKYTATTFIEIKEFELEKISAMATPNNVLAVFEKRKQHADIRFEGKITLLLDTIQDPGNFGTIIRNADWFGIESVICSRDCADMYNPKVVQSTMGSLGRVNILYDNPGEWIQKNSAVKIYAATLHGTAVSRLKGIREGIIIIGNEARGISEELMQLVNEKITIPKKGEAESLNAAVASGIILSHIREI